MKMKNTISLESAHLANCYADDFSVIFVFSAPNQIIIHTLESNSLKNISHFVIESDLNPHLSACIDESCIYIPTKLGQILAIDKFSGQILTTFNTALPIVSDIRCDEENVYCICGVPISKKWTLSTDNFCVCIFDKNTGEKKAQTSYFKGNPTSLTLFFNIHVISGTYIFLFRKNGELIEEKDFSVLMNTDPIHSNTNSLYLYDDTLFVCSPLSLSLKYKIKVKQHVSDQFWINNKLFWFTVDGVYRVDYLKQEDYEIKLNKEMTSNAISAENKLIGCDKTGSIISFDTETQEIQSIKLVNNALRNPVFTENNIIVSSENRIHLLEI